MTDATAAGQTAGDFDLNIEKVLDGWEVPHAIRELIANALDEAVLSGTAEPVIERMSPGTWRIRDFGRGLKHVHLTQNESAEKREHERDVIGRFGVGLKDALAVLDRRRANVVIRSRHWWSTIGSLRRRGLIVQEGSRRVATYRLAGSD